MIPPGRQSWGERIGTIVVVIAAIVLIWCAFRFGDGVDTAFFGLIVAFALGIAGLGVHVAAREARLRRETGPRTDQG